MAVSVVTTTSATYSGVAGPTLNFGVSPIEDDVIIAFVAATTNSAFNGSAPPAGWTNCLTAAATVITPSDTTFAMAAIAHTVSAAEDTANTTSWSLATLWSVTKIGEVVAVILRGIDLAAIIDAFGTVTNATTSTTHVLPAVAAADITSAGFVLRAVGSDGLGTYTTPAGHTQQQAGTNTNQALWVGSLDTAASPGVDVTATNITVSALDESIGISLVLTPEAGGAPIDLVVDDLTVDVVIDTFNIDPIVELVVADCEVVTTIDGVAINAVLPVQRVAQGSVGYATATASMGLTFSGYVPVAGDRVVLFPLASTVTAVLDVAGWTNVQGTGGKVQPDDATFQVSCFHHQVTADEASAAVNTYVLTNVFNTARPGNLLGCVLRGVRPAVPVDTYGYYHEDSTLTNHVIAGLTSPSADCRVLRYVAKDATGTYGSLPAGHTQVATDNTTGTSLALLIERDAATTSGDIAAANITTQADECVSISVAFASASSVTTLVVSDCIVDTTITQIAITASGFTVSDAVVATTIDQVTIEVVGAALTLVVGTLVVDVVSDTLPIAITPGLLVSPMFVDVEIPTIELETPGDLRVRPLDVDIVIDPITLAFTAPVHLYYGEIPIYACYYGSTPVDPADIHYGSH